MDHWLATTLIFLAALGICWLVHRMSSKLGAPQLGLVLVSFFVLALVRLAPIHTFVTMLTVSIWHHCFRRLEDGSAVSSNKWVGAAKGVLHAVGGFGLFYGLAWVRQLIDGMIDG